MEGGGVLRRPGVTMTVVATQKQAKIPMSAMHRFFVADILRRAAMSGTNSCPSINVMTAAKGGGGKAELPNSKAGRSIQPLPVDKKGLRLSLSASRPLVLPPRAGASQGG
mmetsp:Transcript_11265/g.27722  ORF Transcript_11265/g.27722 Transcript_11265/m.27722 type:complete len:110 (+) Transcript_11265:2078-2407(+)